MELNILKNAHTQGVLSFEMSRRVEDVERTIGTDWAFEDETQTRAIQFSSIVYPENLLLLENNIVATVRRVERTSVSNDTLSQTKVENFYIFRCASVDPKKDMAKLIFVYSAERDSWDLVDRVVEEKFRGGGIGSEFLNLAERCIQSYAEEIGNPQLLTASNVGQKRVMKWLQKNGWSPFDEDQAKYEIVERDDDCLITKSDPQNSDAQNWLYDKAVLSVFEAQYGDIFSIQNVVRRPYIFRSFLVRFKKILSPKNDSSVRTIQGDTRERIGLSKH